ncbi:cytochrome P450 750A1 [Cryptomeria japonica]|uniref:cytochrome P450 750A1 n=1 Tax=Cryptomeria japonica TaxID=3369 RepID=UPI0027D9F455|nr:cytochrome P450 750A1 [Cryptomeria japonica]
MALIEIPQIRAEQLSSQTTALALVFVVLVWVLYCFKKNSKLPPGPIPWPIIGNLHQLGRLPHRNLYELLKKYGPVMFLRFGPKPCVVISSSAMAKEFLKTHDLVFANRPRSAAGEHIAYNYKNLGMCSYGAYWRHMRKICVMELLSAKRIESFRFTREEEISLAVKSVWERSKQGTVAVNVSKTLLEITSAIIWRMLTGTRFADDDVSGSGGDLRDMVREITSTMADVNIGDLFPYIDWMDLQGIKKRMKKAHNFFDGIAERIIDEHVKQRRRALDENREWTKDIIDVLLDVAESQALEIEITRENIKAILSDLFIGGMETTTTTLEWAMTGLIRHPLVAVKLQEEIDSVVEKDRMVTESDLPNMDYLQCVLKESLRLYLPGPLLLPHESSQACTVGPQGYVIPAKTQLIINAWAIARDPIVWEDAEEFKPERFMGSKTFDYQGQEFDMLPFGAGRRRCPGGHMAMGQMSLIIAQLWHCFDWRVEGHTADLDMTEEFGATVPRKFNLFAFPSLKLSTSF